MTDLHTRRGRFDIAHPFLDDVIEGGLTALFDGLIVTDIQHNYMHGTTTYFAYSQHFDECEQTMPIPTYRAILTKNEDGTVIVSWNKE